MSAGWKGQKMELIGMVNVVYDLQKMNHDPQSAPYFSFSSPPTGAPDSSFSPSRVGEEGLLVLVRRCLH